MKLEFFRRRKWCRDNERRKKGVFPTQRERCQHWSSITKPGDNIAKEGKTVAKEGENNDVVYDEVMESFCLKSIL